MELLHESRLSVHRGCATGFWATTTRFSRRVKPERAAKGPNILRHHRVKTREITGVTTSASVSVPQRRSVAAGVTLGSRKKMLFSLSEIHLGGTSYFQRRSLWCP
jgi:hypothetical protein